MIYLIKSGILVTPFVVLFFTVGMFLRGWNLNRCYSCGARKIRPARTTGLLEHVLGVVGIHPLRCECCRARFFAIGSPAAESAPARVPKPRFVVRVGFYWVDGLLDRVVIRRVALAPAPAVQNTKPGPLSASPAVLLHT